MSEHQQARYPQEPHQEADERAPGGVGDWRVRRIAGNGEDHRRRTEQREETVGTLASGELVRPCH